MPKKKSKQTSQATVQTILGHKFRDSNLLTEALEAAGRAIYFETTGGIDGNKRLALLGDALLQLVILDEWFSSKKTRANAAAKLRDCASNTNLQKRAESLKLTTHILHNPAQPPEKGPTPRRTAAATVEALLAAVWLDSDKDIEEVRKAMANLGMT